MFPEGISDEQRFGVWVTSGVHIILLVVAIFIYVGKEPPPRAAFMTVTLGNYSEGKPAQHAKKKQPKVATRPNPSKAKPDKPKVEEHKKPKTEQKEKKKVTKQVNLPEQKQDVKSKPVKTPKTQKTNPKKSQDKPQKKQVEVAPESNKGETVQKGAKTSGDKSGTKGDVKADQGKGNNEKKSAPYLLKWEGDINRTPMVQPMPGYTVDVEAVITMRFQVKPDGSVGRIIPLKKMNPELEKEVIKTLRNWRFSPLPSGVPQQPQWGTITFRFVLD
jgi:TonB family protein